MRGNGGGMDSSGNITSKSQSAAMHETAGQGKKISDPELIPQFSSSADYSGNYPDDMKLTVKDCGGVIFVENAAGKARGNIREDSGCDYLLFPPVDRDCTICADITIKSIDLKTDKQGVAIGQFDAVKGRRVYCDVLHGQKNFVFQHTYSSQCGMGACGNPKSAALDREEFIDTTFTLIYMKRDNTAVLQVEDAYGRKLISTKSGDDSFDLASSYATLSSGSNVRYGLAFSGISAVVSSLKLIDADGSVIYDEDDYYDDDIEPCVAERITKTEVSLDRLIINIEWTAVNYTEGGSYVIMASRDGGEYEFAGRSKRCSYMYAPEASGSYTFKVYGVTGKKDSSASAAVSEPLSYLKPLETVSLSASGDANGVNITVMCTDDAEYYDIYRRCAGGSYELLRTFMSKEAAGGSIEFTDVPEPELPVYYYAVGRTESNAGNPGEVRQALRTAGHEGEYVCGEREAVLHISDKSNDTVLDGKFYIAGSYDIDGMYYVYVNGAVIQKTQYNAKDRLVVQGDLRSGRNDVEIVFADNMGNKSRAAFSFVSAEHYDILVDANAPQQSAEGSGTYTSINDALASVPDDNEDTKVVFVKNGTYNERVVITKPNVHILGEDALKTRICHSASVAGGSATGMRDRNAVYVDYTARNLRLENIYIENTYKYTNGNDQQADALAVTADMFSAYNVRLVGFQDTLLVDSASAGGFTPDVIARQYFYRCYITGNVDFIYGSGQAVFKECDIVARYTPYKENGCFTAARTSGNFKSGFIFIKCRLYGEDKTARGAFVLARPWGRDACTVFLHCYMGSVVTKRGYADMSGNSYKNARFAEFDSYGEGFAVNDDRPLLSREQADEYLFYC